MRNILNTPTKALAADLACWASLIALLVYAIVSVSNLLVVGVLVALTGAVTVFALVYNGRNIRTVVRSKLANRRYRREAAEREARELEQEREDARLRSINLERDLRNVLNRYS